jgi:hypothetical protein
MKTLSDKSYYAVSAHQYRTYALLQNSNWAQLRGFGKSRSKFRLRRWKLEKAKVGLRWFALSCWVSFLPEAGIRRKWQWKWSPASCRGAFLAQIYHTYRDEESIWPSIGNLWTKKHLQNAFPPQPKVRAVWIWFLLFTDHQRILKYEDK